MKTDILTTEKQLLFSKKTFRKQLQKHLNLTQVSAPIAVLEGTGINDDLNGHERCVNFPVKALQDRKAVVVNSLAKWKRCRLKELEMQPNSGIITDMRAIRPDEDYSPIHSIYVDQWDWEKVITPEERTLASLKHTVKAIFKALRKTEEKLHKKHGIDKKLPKEITFIHAEDLLKMYPDSSPKERENKITKKFGAVFLIGIGGALSNGEPHDGRAPDYDDWSTPTLNGYSGLNGDILLWNPILKHAFEISSMGIRVSPETLMQQLKIRNQLEKQHFYYHQLLLKKVLPASIGGGIGQSRICMFLLNKKHIGEVQSSIWDTGIMEQCQKEKIDLL